ncbi:MAG TPA: hypothetical protein PK644_09570, partial [bacterium]|nr:hypothetical protein [bacterium]
MTRIFLTGSAVIVLAWASLVLAEGEPEVPGRLEKDRQVIELITRMRHIEEEVVRQDQELQMLRQQFRQRLNQKLQSHTEYTRLKRQLHEIKPGLSQRRG